MPRCQSLNLSLFPPSSYEVRVVCEKKFGPLKLFMQKTLSRAGLTSWLGGEAGEVRCKGLGSDICPLLEDHCKVQGLEKCVFVT